MEVTAPYITQDGPADGATRARILDAAFSCAERYGLSRTTMADVAREARLARQTVYRHFEGRHALIAALVLREEQRIVAAVREATSPHAELRPALEAAFVTCLRVLRQHPLLDKVMATEPQELLPYLTVDASPVMTLGNRLMEHVFERRAPDADPRLVHRAAETCARVFISFAISPPADGIEEVASSLADLIVNGVGA